MSSIETAIRVLRDEADAILSLIDKLDNNFESAVDLILHANGRVILTGMGKSGHIAKKVSATMASTGTPSFFLHPAEGIHGDLGMVTAEDVVVAYSNSGETGEILNILPSLKMQILYWMQVFYKRLIPSDWLRPVQRQRHWHLAMLWQWRLWKKRILLPINLRYFIRADLWENVCL